MAKIWDIPFANAGDKQTIPVPAQPDGTVSTTQGWTPDYELPNTNPAYKPVGREEMNGALFEVTESIRQLQLQGAAEWSPLFAAYPNGAEVIHLGERWRSATSGNNTIPGDVGATWALVGASASETVPGIAEIATQTEVNAGTDDQRIVTPLKLKSGFAISLTANGYIKLPNWMGGIIIQWGQSNYPNAVSVNQQYTHSITLPFSFPNSMFAQFANCQDSSGGVDAITVQARNTGSLSALELVFRSVTSATAGSVAFRWFAIGN